MLYEYYDILHECKLVFMGLKSWTKNIYINIFHEYNRRIKGRDENVRLGCEY